MKNVAILQQSLPANLISVDSIPASIKDGVLELYHAFADPGQKDDMGKAFTMKSYIRAIEGRHQFLVLWCLEHLVLHNPRNPFRPSAQDVHEFIGKTAGRWDRAIEEYYLEDTFRQHAKWDATLDGPPSHDGTCPLPNDMIVSAISRHMVRSLQYNPHFKSDLERLSDARFALLPKSAFPGTLYQDALLLRSAYKRRNGPLQELEKYRAEMGEELWRFRAIILLAHRRNVRARDAIDDLAEDSLMEKARQAHSRWWEFCGDWKQRARAELDKKKFIEGFEDVYTAEHVYESDLRCIPLAELERDYP